MTHAPTPAAGARPDLAAVPFTSGRRLCDPELRGFYPEIEPYSTEMVAVGDGHTLNVEQSGNPEGKPVVFLHGGPGSGVNATQRRVFDPERYRIVLFDQRMAGRSTPHASAPEADLSTNTTWKLVEDIETLREHLGIERWQVFGGSWGSCLALAYAERHPERVSELVLRGIFTLRKSELDWFYEGAMAHVYPDTWAKYAAVVPEELRHLSMREAYARLLADPDPAVHVPAGQAWSELEAVGVHLYRDDEGIAKAIDPRQATAFARIENHFFVNEGWMRDGELIEGADALAEIPTVIVQGRYDMCTPATTAFELAARMPHAEFIVTPDAGHAFNEPSTLDALVRATDGFASRR